MLQDSSDASVTARSSRGEVYYWAWRLGASASGAWIIDTAVFGLFFVLIGLPLLLVLGQSFFPDLFSRDAPSWSFGIATIIGVLTDPRTLQATYNSAMLASLAAVTATALGGLFSFALRRTNVPCRRFLALTPWLVFLTPGYLKGLAWVLLMSPGGYLAQLNLLYAPLSQAFFSIGGLIFVHTLNLFSVAYFIIDGALVGLGGEFEDAARLSGAGPLRIWIRINGPLLAPAVVLSLLAIFAEVLSDFGLASTIARTSEFGLLTYGIYIAANDFPVNFPLAGTEGLLLLSLVFVAVAGDRLLRRQARVKLISGGSKPARIYRLGLMRFILAAILALVSMLAIYLPLAAILARSFCRTLGLGLVSSNFTTKFFWQVLSPDQPAHMALVRSLFYAGLTACIATSVALLLGDRLERASSNMRTATLTVALASISIPGIVLGFGYILLWNRVPFFSALGFPEYGSWSLLVLGYAAATLPYALVIVLTATGQIGHSTRDAARLAGIGGLRQLLLIVVPLIGVSLTAAFVLSFLRTVFELPISQLLMPLGGAPAPPMIVRLFGNDDDGIGSALSLMSMLSSGLISGGVVLLGRFLLSRPGRARALPRQAALKTPTVIAVGQS